MGGFWKSTSWGTRKYVSQTSQEVEDGIMHCDWNKNAASIFLMLIFNVLQMIRSPVGGFWKSNLWNLQGTPQNCAYCYTNSHRSLQTINASKNISSNWRRQDQALGLLKYLSNVWPAQKPKIYMYCCILTLKLNKEIIFMHKYSMHTCEICQPFSGPLDKRPLEG